MSKIAISVNTTIFIRQTLFLIGQHVSTLTLILLTWRIWWAPKNASKWQKGFNSVFKG